MISKEEILSNLNNFGYCVVPGYWTSERCDLALQEVYSLPMHVFENGQGGDVRCQHSNRHIKSANEFINDSFILDIAKRYSSCNTPNRTVAGILNFRTGENIDSGGGWHLDSKKEHQFKSMLYLTNVSEDNGPFMFVANSKESVKDLPTFSNLRIMDEAIVKNYKNEDIIEITGRAGTLVMFDSTFPHRGKRIDADSRVAYTTYFY